MTDETRVKIHCSSDIVIARQAGRTMARDAGFDGSELTVIATAISEVARNIVDHAKCGQLTIARFSQNGKSGISIVANDRGPGIPNIERATQFGYSTRGGLGVGLPGAKLLMDEFKIVSTVGKGTTVMMKKWLR